MDIIRKVIIVEVGVVVIGGIIVIIFIGQLDIGVVRVLQFYF